MVGGNEISTEGIGHGRPHRLAGLDPCGTEICDNLVDARPSYQLGSVRIWNLQWGGESRLRWGKVAPDVMVSPWCHGVGGVWGRHGEVAVVFLLQIAVGATWVAAELRGNRFSTEADLLLGAGLGLTEAAVESGRGRIVRGRFGPAEAAMGSWARLLLGAGSGPPGWFVGGVERHTVRGRFGSCRGGCGFGERSHRTRSARNLPRRPRRRSRGAAYRSEQHIRACSDITLVDPEWLRRSVLGRPDS